MGMQTQAMIGAVWALVVALAAGAPAHAASGDDGEHVRVKLISEQASLIAGRVNWLGVQFDIDPGWHLYWKGQNDTGFPIEVTPEFPEGYAAGEMLWPVPTRHVLPGDLLDYIYEKRVVLLLPVSVPKLAAPGERGRLKVKCAWMVCQNSCIAGTGDASVELPVVGAGTEPMKSAAAEVFSETRDRLPKPAPPDGSVLKTEWKDSTLVVTSGKGRKLAFYPLEESAKLTNAIRDGASSSGRLDLHFEEPARVVGVVEIKPDSGDVRPIVLSVDVPGPVKNPVQQPASNPSGH